MISAGVSMGSDANTRPHRCQYGIAFHRTPVASHNTDVNKQRPEDPGLAGRIKDLCAARRRHVLNDDGEVNHNGLAADILRVTGEEISQPTITRIMGGKVKNGNPKTIRVLASYFAVTAAELRGETAPRKIASDIEPKHLDLLRMFVKLPAEVQHDLWVLIGTLSALQRPDVIEHERKSAEFTAKLRRQKERA